MAYQNNANRTEPTVPVLLSDRIPPQALEVERTVLGSMLIDSQAALNAIDILDEDCFYSTANARIFLCMKEMFEKSIPVDIVTITDLLRKKGWLESVGEETYLGELAECIATSANIEYYANILREKAILRKLITVAGEITTECFNVDVEPQEVVDKAESRIFGISESRIKNKFESMADLLPKTFEEIEGYTKGNFKGVQTGFKELDEMTTGLQPGDLVIVAGRPSMGKTAFVLSLALNTSMKYKNPTAIFSLEMSKESLVQRMLCSEARVNMHQLRSGTLPKRDLPKLSLAAGLSC